MRSFPRPSVARAAGQLATLTFALAILLQLALALGLLPITMAWGGSQPLLTTPLRLASLFAASVLALAAGVMRRRAGLAGTWPPGTAVKVLAWVITASLALNSSRNLVNDALLAYRSARVALARAQGAVRELP